MTTKTTKPIEHKPGYKKTKLGWIPEEWELKKIKEIAKVNPPKPKLNDNELVAFLAMEDVSNEASVLNKTDRFYHEVNNGFTSFINGDILVAKITPCFENGKGALVKDLTNGVGFGSTEFHVIRAHKEIEVAFLYYHTISYPFRGKGEQNMTGSAGQKRVPKSFIENYKIPLPSLPEQKKIAEILSTWDAAIEKTRALITAKEKLKKALMQQLLTGKRRFREFEGQEWREFALNDFLIPTLREVEKPMSNYLALGIRSHGKGTFLKPNSDPTQNVMEKLFVVHKNDLIVNITFAWEGAIAVVNTKDHGALVSHRFPTYTFITNMSIPEFFRYVIIQKRFRYILGLISPGGAGRNRVLSKKDFLKIKWKLPSVVEQQKIAAVLQTADREIELLRQKLDALQRQKKGLMQKLLTGQVRV